jgi:hypothetical protein
MQKQPPPPKAVKAHNRQTFTEFDFTITGHTGKKAIESGQFKSTMWHGTLALETSKPVNNEVDAERDLETLLANGFLPHFGIAPALLTGIHFTWASREAPNDSGGDPQTICSVQVNYIAAIETVSGAEAAYRLQQMFGSDWQDTISKLGSKA